MPTICFYARSHKQRSALRPMHLQSQRRARRARNDTAVNVHMLAQFMASALVRF